MLSEHKTLFNNQINKLQIKFNFLANNTDTLADSDINLIFENIESDFEWLRKNILIRDKLSIFKNTRNLKGIDYVIPKKI